MNRGRDDIAAVATGKVQQKYNNEPSASVDGRKLFGARKRLNAEKTRSYADPCRHEVAASNTVYEPFLDPILHGKRRAIQHADGKIVHLR